MKQTARFVCGGLFLALTPLTLAFAVLLWLLERWKRRDVPWTELPG